MSGFDRTGRGSGGADSANRDFLPQFRALLDAVPDTLVLISPELRVLWANRAAGAKLGVRNADLEGRLCHEVWHCSDSPCAVCPVQASYASGHPEMREVNDPAGRAWELRTAPVIAADGSVSGVIELARDVSEHRQLQERLVHAQKLEAVGRLAGGIAHDFNNYLAAIAGFAELALDNLPSGAPARDQVESARATALRAGEVTRRLLAFSRREPVRLRSIDLAAHVAASADLLRQLLGPDTVLEIRASSGLGYVEADPAQIEQLLVNLVVNAREAMPAGGTITIEARNHRVPAPGGPGDVAAGDYVALSVRDTGAGMSPEVQRRLFEPFFTTKTTGTGLGLATVHGIVRGSGGRVQVESGRGSGTTVEILLPTTDRTPAPTEDLPAGRPATGTETVLVVDDRDDVRRVTAGILRRLGYQVLDASGGEKALALAAAHPGPIDLLLSDVVMPGMGGTRLAQRIREARPALGVLFVTGHDASLTADDPALAAAARVLRKPFTSQTLGAAVREAIDRQRARESARRTGREETT